MKKLILFILKDKNIIDKAKFHAQLAMADAPDELKQMIAPLGVQ